MERADVRELYYISHMQNLPSILRRGILSHNEAKKYNPTSVANPSVQAMRVVKAVPGGKNLHDYACLYFWPRNAMLFSILGFPSQPPPEHLNLCIIGVGATVLDSPGVVISDMNAATLLSKFSPYPGGLADLNKEIIFADSWRDPDPIVMEYKKQAMMAEGLVPNVVRSNYLQHFYVCCQEAKREAEAKGFGVTFSISRHLFFNQPGRHHD